MRAILVTLAALVSASCALAQTTPGAPKPLRIGPVTSFEDPAITESSGIVASRQFPGMLWTHNDGGNAPTIFATDTLARQRGTVRIADATNRDWEDIALGPCRDGGACLYLADVGDNRRVRPYGTIYRFPEPDAERLRSDTVSTVAAVETLAFTYPDGPQDVEAMYAHPSGDLFLITKSGETIRHYRLPATMWGTTEAIVAQRVGTFPIDPGTTRLAGVTGADLSADGRYLVVRTYRELFFYVVDPNGEVSQGPATTCPVLGLESQGEGVGWLDRDRVVLTSERGIFGRGTVAVVRCRLPWIDGGSP